MSVVEVLDLLRCPLCTRPFHDDGGGVRCSDGHCFDLARQGYLNLLGTRPPRHADTPSMVAARERFLRSGAYAPVAAAVVDAVRAGLRTSPGVAGSTPALLEPGAGTGYYTAALLEGLGGRAVALDISAAAARRAARAHPGVAAVVADAWAPLPIPDGVLDGVVSVFAPRNATEFARVLRPGGVLVVATPRDGHLQELREAWGLLEVEQGKQERLTASLAQHFTPVAEVEVRFEAAWPPDLVVDLVAMGPNAFHTDPTEVATRGAGLPETLAVTVEVAVSTWVIRPT